MAQQKKHVPHSFSFPHQLCCIVLKLTSATTSSSYFSSFSWVTALLFGIYTNNS